MSQSGYLSEEQAKKLTEGLPVKPWAYVRKEEKKMFNSPMLKYTFLLKKWNDSTIQIEFILTPESLAYAYDPDNIVMTTAREKIKEYFQ